MKLRHLPPVLFLLVTALSLPSFSFRRNLFLPRDPSPSQQHHAGDDALLRRLAAVDAGADQVLAEAAAMLANASITSSTHHHSSSLGNGHHRLLTLRLPCCSSNATVSRLRVPYDTLPEDGALLAAFRASLRSFLLAHHHIRRRRGGANNAAIASVMRDLPGLLGRRRRFPTCAVVGNSGILLGSGRGPQIDAHDFVVRLNNAPAGAAAAFAPDVGSKTSLAFAHSFVLRRCAGPSAATVPGCACHPYGRSVPLAMYVSHPAHLLDALACGATATPASPFRLRLTDARLDALCACIAKYYSMRRFVAATGEPESNWRGGDERTPHFHYSSGLQAVVMALGACEEVSMFGFGKAAGAKHHYHTDRKKETEVHDYEAEYQFYRDLQWRPEAVPFLDEAPAGFKLPPVKQYW
ncbi:sialyltransferase-like protein 2 [Setaria viridis]|uniref:Sialyltransferase-like protein n=1 Tax=Setaria viridis TaxID=4556 RepID=A0A4U6TF41_SETVI|nr:sialyltransferase-like protein 2 [Setaria viridis]TKV99292.1 hypothetical protein SEVIR_8G033300v2 [Setaria viridis]